jgi:hypothetical protein
MNRRTIIDGRSLRVNNSHHPLLLLRRLPQAPVAAGATLVERPLVALSLWISRMLSEAALEPVGPLLHHRIAM